jgi:hypothetical protein
VTNPPQPVDWFLVRRICRIVASAPGGGLHRDELASRSGAYGADFGLALMVAYSRKKVDFCGRYVVKPAKGIKPDA